MVEARYRALRKGVPEQFVIKVVGKNPANRVEPREKLSSLCCSLA
jgi:hypothetical protein